MSDGEIHCDAVGRRAVFEEHLHGVTDITLIWRVVLLRVRGILAYLHLPTESVDAWIASNIVLVVSSSESTEDQRDGNHVLNAVVAVGGIRERTGLVDDANARFLGLNHDFVDLIDALLHL